MLHYLLLNLQIAYYILCSLLLSAFYVSACAVMWKLYSMPTSSKPWLVFYLLFVHCMRLTFWLQLLKHCCCCCFCCFCSTRKMPKEAAIRKMSDTLKTERIRLSTKPDQTASGNNEGIERQEVDKQDVGQTKVKFGRPVGKLFERIENINSWKNVALGLNCLTTAFYLLGNALAFAFYLYPLLYRIIKHSAITGYVVDTK